MNMIVHYPKAEADQKDLGKKAALIHNQAVLQYLKQLSCPNYQKQALLKEMYPDHL
ncbi:hypothetical protein [Lacrimispora sp. JR3]|uniref:hypothetical protein n=1 Tax=Lacrimispora sinapis TaxID=3111456 RepID=UPI003748D9A6